MNKNSRQRKAAAKGKWQRRKSTQPKVGRSADAIMRKNWTIR
jgi:hypothetical protein